MDTPTSSAHGVTNETPSVSIQQIKKAGLISDKLKTDVIVWVHPHLAIEFYFHIKAGQEDLRFISCAMAYVDEKEVNRQFKEGSVVVTLDTTPANYGGKRYWFLCPKCLNPVSILYLQDGLACRKCHHLTYPTQKLSGFHKTIGLVRSNEELTDMANGVKRLTYKGKQTKKFLRYLKERDRTKKAQNNALDYIDKLLNKFEKPPDDSSKNDKKPEADKPKTEKPKKREPLSEVEKLGKEAIEMAKFIKELEDLKGSMDAFKA